MLLAQEADFGPPSVNEALSIYLSTGIRGKHPGIMIKP